MTPPKPFFSALHDLLDREGEVTLGELPRAMGGQTYGLLILLLSLPGLLPGINVGAAPLGGLGVIALGLQMLWGVPQPWVPERFRRVPFHKGRIKGGLARLEGLLRRFSGPRAAPRSIHKGWVGLGVAWTGLLLAAPIPLPFANILPAAILCLFGAAILEERPLWAWLATAASLGNTAYCAMSFGLIVSGVRAMLP